ncbi:MAG: hypothetical protein K6T83_19325, partial [Alicyclobacillus sp.]|nr:hypothetical protein [Alicyclobacillus sp.]
SHMAVHALSELALVLMVLTVATNLVARMLVRRGGRAGRTRARGKVLAVGGERNADSDVRLETRAEVSQ